MKFIYESKNTMSLDEYLKNGNDNRVTAAVSSCFAQLSNKITYVNDVRSYIMYDYVFLCSFIKMLYEYNIPFMVDNAGMKDGYFLFDGNDSYLFSVTKIRFNDADTFLKSKLPSPKILNTIKLMSIV